ncbi:MAG: DUF362 domain-containing protein [Candidatus Aminicenantes bacterium]|nr:DUF362 domain-containing protein [Candidatus Aminicenantes bacterium]
MPPSRVVSVKAGNIIGRDGAVDPKRVRLALEAGLAALAEAPGIREALDRLFKRDERFGIKINTIAGPALSTLPETSLPLARLLLESRLAPKSVVIWDRTNRELRDAGYTLNLGSSGPSVLGTDTEGFGYERELVSHKNIGSLFSTILSRRVTSSISLAILKDHGLAGVTGGMKNYFGAVHNPNKYHDTGCDPFVAELFETDEIRSRHRLTILDALVVQFHRGPSHHPRWAKKLETFLFSLDPVAADSAGWSVIERLRARAGLPSLEEEGREPTYLRTAEKMGLGVARSDGIRLVEIEV